MKTKTVGTVINYLLSGVLIVSGVLKIIGFTPYEEMISRLSPHYFENIYLIGFVAIACGILFAIPKFFSYGFIATLVFLGGTISAHMQIGDNFIPQIVFVLLAATTAYIKKPEWFKTS